jgi:hypothetical protein
MVPIQLRIVLCVTQVLLTLTIHILKVVVQHVKMTELVQFANSPILNVPIFSVLEKIKDRVYKLHCPQSVARVKQDTSCQIAV